MKKFSYLAIILFSVFTACNQKEVSENEAVWIAETPAGSKYTKIDKNGETVIPNGRILTPRGKQIATAPHPYGLVLSPDGNIAITANSGTNPFSITVIKDITGSNPEAKQIPPGPETDKGILAAVFMGLAVSPDNRFVYVAGGQENKVFIFDLETGDKSGEIDCSGKTGNVNYTHGYLGDMLISDDASRLYVADQINFCVNIIDLKTKAVSIRVPVGRYPFGLALSPAGGKLYVANVGMYEYKKISGIDTKNLNKSGLDYPAFGFNTKESREGTKAEGLDVPGLGDPNAPESFSVWAIDLKAEKPRIVSKIKTGFLVGEKIDGIPAVGGSSPNSLVATEKYVFVSNGNNDCISVIDITTNKVVKNIFLVLDERMKKLRGIIPFGLAISPDKKRLYVAESGINAVGVIDIEKLEVIGHIPVGWFPSKLKVSKDGKKLIVANAKGFGSGPNGGSTFELGPAGSNIGRLMNGSVSVLDIPADEALRYETKQVADNNYMFRKAGAEEFKWRLDNPVPVSNTVGKSPIKYIVFISKENRTYDEVFGQLRNGKGDPELARYGLKRTFTNKDGSIKVENADVMPNHIALAKRFSISDNFYVDADHSADGHRWLVCTYPNEWVETSTSSAYGGGRRMKMESDAPGNAAFVGASGTIYPEDYNEAGSIWDHFMRNKIPYFNFGFSMEHAPGFDDSTLKKLGVRYLFNYPMPGNLYDNTSRIYPCYNMMIPDQYRVDMLIREFNERWLGPGKTMPRVLTVILPNDHGSHERPHAGYPFRESFMADNDLALGRIVEFLSSTPYWKEMAIIVTEDDSQDGVDHIDAHRSVLMVISPYSKKNHVSHVHYSFGSIFKTMWNLLGIPYLNQYDASATDLADMFSAQPDYTSYKALPVDKRIFDPVQAVTPIDEKFNWKESGSAPRLDDPEFILMESKERDKKNAK